MSIKTLATADDFGFTTNTNRAIVEAYEKNRITELSLMVDCYGTPDAVKYIIDNKVKNVGLHFSLCRISQDGKLLRGNDYDDILTNWPPKRLSQAFDEEVKIFEQLVGFTPKHIIGHKQISLNSKIVRHIGAYCVTNNCYARRGERSATLSHFTLKPDETPAGLNIGRTVDVILGFHYGSPKDMYVAYKQELSDLKKSKKINSIEIFFHPGYSTEFEKKLTNFIQQRLDDINFLLSDYFLDLVKEENLELMSSSKIH